LKLDSTASIVSLAAGVSDDAESIGKLGEAVYRGVLHALPASARAWFGDLRDRGLSAAVEVVPLCHAQLLRAFRLIKPRSILWDACRRSCVVCWQGGCVVNAACCYASFRIVPVCLT